MTDDTADMTFTSVDRAIQQLENQDPTEIEKVDLRLYYAADAETRAAAPEPDPEPDPATANGGTFATAAADPETVGPLKRWQTAATDESEDSDDVEPFAPNRGTGAHAVLRALCDRVVVGDQVGLPADEVAPGMDSNSVAAVLTILYRGLLVARTSETVDGNWRYRYRPTGFGTGVADDLGPYPPHAETDDDTDTTEDTQ